ncbi:MAG: hypothetical protein E7665_01620 [Ruminococcaceae bacterium]|nr:hypothetical protein [Oscillospiraceae bacterium]
MNSSSTAQKKNPLMGFIGILLVFLLFISVTASLYTYILNFVIFSEDHYASIEISDEYIAKIKSYIEEELDTATGRYSLPYEIVSGLLSDEAIIDISKDMIFKVYRSLLTGTEHVETVYDISLYKEAISAYIKTLPEGHILSDPAVYEPLFTRLEETITYSLDPIPVAQIKKFVPGISSAMQAGSSVGDLFIVFALVSAVLTVAAMLVPYNKLHLRLYSVSGALFGAATVYFVPAVLISNYDVPSRLALVSDSALRTVISTVWYSITDSLMLSSTVFFVFTCILAIVSTVYITVHNIRSEKAELAILSGNITITDSSSESEKVPEVAHIGVKRTPKRFIEPIKDENNPDENRTKTVNEDTNTTQTE